MAQQGVIVQHSTRLHASAETAVAGQLDHKDGVGVQSFAGMQ
jgi:hypothetical protein